MRVFNTRMELRGLVEGVGGGGDGSARAWEWLVG